MKRLLLSLALLLTIGAGCASAAISVIQHEVSDQLSGATTISVPVTSTTAGHLIVVGVLLGGTSGLTVSGVSDTASGGSNIYTQGLGAQATFGSGGGSTDIWYCLSAPRGGATTISATVSGTGLFYSNIFVWEVSGFTTAAFDLAGIVTNGAGSGNDLNGPSLTTTSTTGFIAAVANPGASITVNPKVGNEFTSGGDISVLGATGGCSLISTTATAHKPVWTDSASGDPFASSAVAFKEAGGGGGCTAPPNQLMMMGVGNCKGH